MHEQRGTYPPLNRPSVRHATSSPRPAPMMRLVGLSISGMPVYDSTRPIISPNSTNMGRKELARHSESQHKHQTQN
jgi:hypothetical protein